MDKGFGNGLHYRNFSRQGVDEWRQKKIKEYSQSIEAESSILTEGKVYYTRRFRIQFGNRIQP
jgi:hypothetical protein